MQTNIAAMDNATSLVPLSAQPTIFELQSYVSKLKKARNFPLNKTKSALALCVQAGNIGHLVEATWDLKGAADETTSLDLKRQIADALIYLFDLANMYEISVVEAFKIREAENMQRQWSVRQLTNELP